MRLPVAEQPGKRCEIHAVGNKIQRLHTGDGPPQKRINPTRVDPGVDGSNSGRLSVDRNLRLAESGRPTAVQQSRKVIRHARVPELIVGLALRIDVDECALDVRWQREAARERACRRVEGYRTAVGTGGER